LLALLGPRLSGAGGAWPPAAVVGLAAGWTLLAQAVFAVNDNFDAPIDATAQPSRPIPSGRLQPRDALHVGLALGHTPAYRLSATSWLGFAVTSYLPAITPGELRTPLYVVLASGLNLVILGVAPALVQERSDLLARLQWITKLVLVAFILAILAVLWTPAPL